MRFIRHTEFDEDRKLCVVRCDARKLYICFSQLTVVGQIGVLGIPVMRLVELVFKSVYETARNQHLKMAGIIARERGSKNSCANYHPAPVSKKQAVT